jgi:parvulin-like peptidyl-prolyl isomerase
LVASAEDVARVDGQTITRGELDREVERFVNASGGKATRTPAVERAVLNQMIREIVRDRHVREQGVEVQSVEIYDAVKERRRQVKEQLGQELEDWVQAQGYDQASFRERLRKDLGLEKYNAKVATPEALRQHLEKHPNRFNGEARLVQHIGLRAGQGGRTAQEAADLARKLREEIAAGADFADVASQKSEGPGKENGGQIGYVKWGDDKLAPAFMRVIFGLETGQVSPPISSGQGSHLFRVAEVKPGAGVALAEVEDKVRKDFLEEHLAAVVQDRMKKAKIETMLK